VGVALVQRWLLAAEPPAGVPASGTPSLALSPGQGEGPSPEPTGPAGYTYFVDVDGWYRITPYETVVRSPFDFTSLTGEELADALPAAVGRWQQAGPNVDLRQDPGVISYLGHPTVALSQSYQDAAGHYLSLSILGNLGDDSFLLFSHTPETCMPGQLWNVVEKRRESAVIDDRPIYAQYLLTRHAQTGEQQMALYWYLWDNPDRDSKKGVLSMRVYSYLGEGETPDDALARAWDFVRALFPATIPWSRF
jgi:hypothetical protein